MSDTTLNRFVGRGTTTQRLAFTPTPPTPASGPDPGYLWWDVTLQAEYAYDFASSSWKATAGTAANAITALTGDVTATGPGSVAATIASNAVTTSKINNAAVTLAKIANAAANSKLLGSGASGSGAAYAEITLGTNLSMSGTTLNASGGGGGAYVLLEQHTTAGASSLDFTSFISSTYDTYIFQLLNVRPATNSQYLAVTAGTGGGPTWDTGNNYRWSGAQWNQGSGGGVSFGAATGVIRISNNLPNTSTLGFSGELRLYDPQSTTNNKYFVSNASFSDDVPNFYASVWGGQYISTTAMTGVRFNVASGNIIGTIRVYGIAK